MIHMWEVVEVSTKRCPMGKQAAAAACRYPKATCEQRILDSPPTIYSRTWSRDWSRCVHVLSSSKVGGAAFGGLIISKVPALDLHEHACSCTCQGKQCVQYRTQGWQAAGTTPAYTFLESLCLTGCSNKCLLVIICSRSRRSLLA